MGTILTRRAYAKVNLHLAVGAPFSDGYHPIESIFSLVDLSDHIEMRWSESNFFSIEVTGLESYCNAGDDTLTKAARLWYERSGIPVSLRVHCEKHIPVKAGLGGGSSDAAVLLTLLQEAAGERAIPSEDLKDIALSVGSDVPFFLSGFSCALVEGRGELVTKLSVEPKHILLALPGEYSVSTKRAYAILDTLLKIHEEAQRPPLPDVIAMLDKRTPEWGSIFFNDFEKCTEFPDFYDSVVLLASRYAGFGSLSGSGSSWYFLSENEKSVLELCGVLEKKFFDKVQLWRTKLI